MHIQPPLQPPPDQASDETQPDAEGLAPRGGTETILLVEDDAGVRAMVQTVLEGHGYRVLIATDGAEGLETFRNHAAEIELVILDIFMPQMSGAEMYRQIRQHDPTARFLFMSGYIEEAAYQALILRGRVDYIQKPFSPVDLLIKVRQILDRPR
ncbi:MAG: response regulator [Acidobacteria bacterium]|nr:response regulator [Acidobacteriota bacterium]MDW7984333.1 response regulator [Acidobacteriota bacterium]